MSVAATMSRSSSSMTGTNFSRTTNARAVTGTAKASPNPTALSRRRPRPAGRRPSGRRSANPDHQGVGEDADAQRDVLADRVAVDLRLDGATGGDGELAAAEAVEAAVAGAVAADEVGDDGEPAERAVGGHDDGVEDAVVELRLGHELEAALERPAVADDDGASVPAHRSARLVVLPL